MKVYELQGHTAVIVTWICDQCGRAATYHGELTQEGIKDRDTMRMGWILVHHSHASLHLCSPRCCDQYIASHASGLARRSAEERLKQAISGMGVEHIPPPGWEARVKERIEQAVNAPVGATCPRCTGQKSPEQDLCDGCIATLTKAGRLDAWRKRR
jgi:hypothetical protein